MSPIFVEAIQQRGVLFSGGFYLSSFDEQDQFSLPVFPDALDPNAATVFARRHVEIPRSDEGKNSLCAVAFKSGFLSPWTSVAVKLPKMRRGGLRPAGGLVP